MGTITKIYAISSIEPIQDAVASSNDDLIDALMKQFLKDCDEPPEEDEFLKEELGYLIDEINSMIRCESPPDMESGGWWQPILLLADYYNLRLDNGEELLPINQGYKHCHVWEQYRDILSGRVSQETDEILLYIQEGRPLVGWEIDREEGIFGWLTPEEVTKLYNSLSELGKPLTTEIEDGDYGNWGEFHRYLMASLKWLKDHNAFLLMTAA